MSGNGQNEPRFSGAPLSAMIDPGSSHSRIVATAVPIGIPVEK